MIRRPDVARLSAGPFEVRFPKGSVAVVWQPTHGRLRRRHPVCVLLMECQAMLTGGGGVARQARVCSQTLVFLALL